MLYTISVISDAYPKKQSKRDKLTAHSVDPLEGKLEEIVGALGLANAVPERGRVWFVIL